MKRISSLGLAFILSLAIVKVVFAGAPFGNPTYLTASTPVINVNVIPGTQVATATPTNTPIATDTPTPTFTPTPTPTFIVVYVGPLTIANTTVAIATAVVGKKHDLILTQNNPANGASNPIGAPKFGSYIFPNFQISGGLALPEMSFIDNVGNVPISYVGPTTGTVVIGGILIEHP